MKKSKILLTIIVAFSISAIVLLTLSLIKPKNIFFLPLAVFCSATSIMANGIKQLIEKSKRMGILNIVVSVMLAIVGIIDLTLKLSIMSHM